MDYLTFSEMKTMVGLEVQDSSSSRRPTLIGNALNREYIDAVQRFRWPSLSKGREGTVTATAGDSFIRLAKDVGHLYFLRNGSVGSEIAHQAIENFFRRQGLGVDTAGVIWSYTDAGHDGKLADIDTAELLTVSSSNASGDNGKTILIHGVVSGEELFESVTLPGAGGVNTTNTFSDIYAVSSGGSQVGVVTVSGQSSAVTYSTLAPGERTAKYRKIRFSMKPAAADAITYYYKKTVPLLTSDDQVPEIPASTALVKLAVAHTLLQQRRDQNATIRLQEAQDSLQLAFDSTRQDESIQQATPLVTGYGRSRGRSGGAVVVRNG